MKKRRIVIASVLKPVDDTRMFGKMGKSLGDSGIYDIHIIGYPSSAIPAYPNVRFLPLKPFARISVNRLLASWKVLLKTIKVKPYILIVNTHELLIVAIAIRILFGTRIVYDVRENYYKNIRYSDAFPPWIRPGLAGWVRLKEKLASPFFHHFFLAETGYKKEMDFFAGRATVIENKAIVPRLSRDPQPGTLRLLFSGTLAESTGVFQAIELAKKLNAANPAVRLLIIGYAAKKETLDKIMDGIKELSFIQLSGGGRLVPHTEVMKAIFASDFGIVAYPLSPQTENTIPTKLYEYLACQLPILLQNHPPWVDLCTPYHACLPIDFPNANPDLLLQQMQASFYTTPAAGVTWESEAGKFLEVVGEI